MRNALIGLGGLVAMAACGEEETARLTPDPDPFPSTYKAYPSDNFVLRGATILTGTGERIERGDVAVSGGRIVRVGGVGANVRGLVEIDARGMTITPGIIDIHSHLGVYPSPGFASTADGNESTAPNTAGVWAEHSVWPQDPGFTRALAGGVTAMQILPGSANLFGGRSVTLKNVPGRTVQEMKFPGAPYGMKMACGENPKRVYGDRGGPSTRMANFRGYREGFEGAKQYAASWREYAANPEGKQAPARDFNKETIAAVLDGDILVHMHCYRGDEMAQVLDMADEYGYEVSAFHHGVEGYKVADLLAERGVCGAVWADWWGFKLEAYDAVLPNAALIAAQPGGCAIIHSDSALGIQRLNQEAAKAMRDGRAIGLDIDPEDAIAWITANPAKAMGILEQTGTLEVGKMADITVWDGDPFSVYTKASKVFIDGALMYDADDPAVSPRSDFELAQRGVPGTGGAGQ